MDGLQRRRGLDPFDIDTRRDFLREIYARSLELELGASDCPLGFGHRYERASPNLQLDSDYCLIQRRIITAPPLTGRHFQ